MQLSEKIKTLREDHGYMQKDVSNKLGIAPNTLSGYERGLRYPDAKTLKKIAEFYNVTTDALINDDLHQSNTDELDWNKLIDKILCCNEYEQRKLYKMLRSYLEN